MLYLVSDIHGNIKKFKKLLKTIEFDSKIDNMIILGDILDRGSDGVEILNFLKPLIKDGTVELLQGNHELFCIMYLDGKLDTNLWDAFGGEGTRRAIDKMSEEDKHELKDFLKSLPICSENHSKYLGKFICTHSGLHAEHLIRNEDGTINVWKSIEEAYKEDCYNYMCGMDLHYLPSSVKEALDVYMIVGHVPCSRVREEIDDNRFIRTSSYMDIDSGCGHGGKLGCYIVDTDEEIYV